MWTRTMNERKKRAHVHFIRLIHFTLRKLKLVLPVRCVDVFIVIKANTFWRKNDSSMNIQIKCHERSNRPLIYAWLLRRVQIHRYMDFFSVTANKSRMHGAEREKCRQHKHESYRGCCVHIFPFCFLEDYLRQYTIELHLNQFGGNQFFT